MNTEDLLRHQLAGAQTLLKEEHAARMARSRGEPFSAYTPSGGHPATPEQLAQEAGDIAREARRDQRRAELVRAFSDLHHDISTEARAPRVPRRTNPHD